MPGCMFHPSNANGQCSENREGVLCGQCSGNTSVGLRYYCFITVNVGFLGDFYITREGTSPQGDYLPNEDISPWMGDLQIKKGLIQIDSDAVKFGSIWIDPGVDRWIDR